MKPIASLSLDLDNQWSYLKTHGNPAWEEYPTYLPAVVPRMLEVLDEVGMQLTLFVVGRDAAEPAHHDLLRSVVDADHEVGNHSFSHEPWFHLYEPDRVEQEVVDAEDAIEAATGRRPNGFRGPGYSLSEPLLEVLADREYRYDASILPTWIGPFARAFYFRSAKLTPEERVERGKLFGNFADVRRPLQPFRWELGARSLLELPVTVLPWRGFPMHVSYVLYLEGTSPKLARAYFRAGVGHLPGDRGGAVAAPPPPRPDRGRRPPRQLGPEFFPGMGMDGARKRRLLRDCLVQFGERFDVGPVGRHAAEIDGADMRRIASSRLSSALRCRRQSRGRWKAGSSLTARRSVVPRWNSSSK